MSEAPWFNRTRRCAVDWPAPLWNAGPPLPSCQSVGLGPSVPLPTYTQPPKGPTATSSFTTTIANYGTQAQVRTHVRLCARVCMCVSAYVRACATSRPLTAISAAGHQRVPTGPNRPGQLASVTFARLLPVLSLFLFFFIFLPLLFSAILLFVSLAARPSVSSPSFPLIIAFFLLSRVRFYVFLFHFVKIIPRYFNIFGNWFFRNNAKKRKMRIVNVKTY